MWLVIDKRGGKSEAEVDTAMRQHTFLLPLESGARLQLADKQQQQQKHAMAPEKVLECPRHKELWAVNSNFCKAIRKKKFSLPSLLSKK